MTTNEKIGVGIVGGVILYLLFKKPKFYILDKDKGSSGGGGGGIMPIIMPIQSAATPTPTPTPVVTTPPKPAESPKATFPTCATGQLWNPATNKCEVIKIEAPVGGGSTAKPPAGSPTPIDPCAAYGGTYDAATNSCLKSAYCGGGTLKLDSNGKATNCSVSNPTSGGVVGFSGKLPLTLDNLLM